MLVVPIFSQLYGARILHIFIMSVLAFYYHWLRNCCI